MMMRVLFVAAVVASASAFYLPGVSPKEYDQSQKVWWAARRTATSGRSCAAGQRVSTVGCLSCRRWS
jgi:hypothetical protein